MNRYYSLDIFRGLACLMVVALHSTYYFTDAPAPDEPLLQFIRRLLRAGWLGVPLFFVISGYCITAACESARKRGGLTRTYFARRFKRIFPPYWILVGLALIVVMAAPALFVDEVRPIPDPRTLSATQWLGNVALIEKWRANIFGPRPLLFMEHAWTLCYEEQFYIVCGLALFAGRHFFTALAGITVLVIACMATSLPSKGFFFDGRWLVFAAGVAVYYRLHCAGRWKRLMDVAGVACAIGVCGYWLTKRTDFATELMAGTVFACLIVALHRWDTRLADNRVARPLCIVGTMCYSLYLVHLPVVKGISHYLFQNGLTSPLHTIAITLPVCVGLSLAVGWLFHVFVERRFLNSQPTMLVNGSAVTVPAWPQFGCPSLAHRVSR